MHYKSTQVRYVLLTLLAIFPAAVSRGEVAQWSEPSLDSWIYVNGFNSGSRILGPSFGGLIVDSQTQQFTAGTQQEPGRIGSALVAFETSGLVMPGLDPSRYSINSVTVTAKSQVGGFEYEDTATTPADLLAEANGSGITEQRPIELFGVGFRDGYVGFDLGLNSTGTLFSEATAPYSASDGGYVTYPVIGDASGDYHDVSNSYNGGFSETAPSNQTAPFNATPWAVGSTSLHCRPNGWSRYHFHLQFESRPTRCRELFAKRACRGCSWIHALIHASSRTTRRGRWSISSVVHERVGRDFRECRGCYP